VEGIPLPGFSRLTAAHFLMYGLIGVFVSDVIRASDLRDPSSTYTSRILYPCQMLEVLNLRDNQISSVPVGALFEHC
jgi:hypothetical protein